jgi:predicted PurR-regulated permease PerM
MNSISNNTVRQVLLLLVIILLGFILFWQLQSFLPAFLGAYTLFVLLKKWMDILVTRYKWRKGGAAMLLMFGSFLVILMPIALLINMLYDKIGFALQHSTQVLNVVQQFIHRYEHKYRMVIASGKTMAELSNWAAQTLPQLLGATFNSITTVAVMYFILYFMLIQGRTMESTLREWLPLKNENLLLIRKETNSLVYSNAIGIPLIALLQGGIAFVGYVALGVDEPLFWFVVTCIASMMPVVGATLAYVPVAILLFASGNNVKGIIMLVWGFGVVSTVDSLFRFWLQKRIGDVHPLITAFGVILGLSLFGFIGLIFGPILISLFLLLIKIYANEFNETKINA